jgi:hypothetical protein
METSAGLSVLGGVGNRATFAPEFDAAEVERRALARVAAFQARSFEVEALEADGGEGDASAPCTLVRVSYAPALLTRAAAGRAIASEEARYSDDIPLYSAETWTAVLAGMALEAVAAGVPARERFSEGAAAKVRRKLRVSGWAPPVVTPRLPRAGAPPFLEHRTRRSRE